MKYQERVRKKEQDDAEKERGKLFKGSRDQRYWMFMRRIEMRELKRNEVRTTDKVVQTG